MSIILEYIDINEIPVPEYCSLYKAVCWIAFGEKPLIEDYDYLYYNDHRNYHYENILIGDVEIDNGVKYVIEDTLKKAVKTPSTFKSDVEEQLVEASNAIHIKALQGKLELKGLKPSKYYVIREDSQEEYQITEEYYGGFKSHMPTKTLHPDEHFPRYTDFDAANNVIEPGFCAHVQVNTADLFREFPQKSELTGQSKDQSSTHEKAGRPPKYDWEAFYRQIVLIADTPDGLPEIQAELEERMADWCDNNWPKSPGESTIRDKIAPLYQGVSKAKN